MSNTDNERPMPDALDTDKPERKAMSQESEVTKCPTCNGTPSERVALCPYCAGEGFTPESGPSCEQIRVQCPRLWRCPDPLHDLADRLASAPPADARLREALREVVNKHRDRAAILRVKASDMDAKGLPDRARTMRARAETHTETADDIEEALRSSPAPLSPSKGARETPIRAVAGTSKVCKACGCRWKAHADGTLQLFDAEQKPCVRCDNAPNPPLRAEEPDDFDAQPPDGYDTIASMLPSILASGSERCPLCGQQGIHEHTPAEILIYRNGVKYGRSLTGFSPPALKSAAPERPVVTEAMRTIIEDCYGRGIAEGANMDHWRGGAAKQAWDDLKALDAAPERPAMADDYGEPCSIEEAYKRQVRISGRLATELRAAEAEARRHERAKDEAEASERAAVNALVAEREEWRKSRDELIEQMNTAVQEGLRWMKCWEIAEAHHATLKAQCEQLAKKMLDRPAMAVDGTALHMAIEMAPDEMRALAASQLRSLLSGPAAASPTVKMPERADVDRDRNGWSEYDIGHAIGWNDALNAVDRLNAPPVSPQDGKERA